MMLAHLVSLPFVYDAKVSIFYSESYIMKKLSLLTLLALLLGACVTESVDDIIKAPSTSDKILAYDGDAHAGLLMVRLAPEATELNIAEIELTTEPLFPGEGNTWMGNWILVHFDESLDLRSVAERIAQESYVECVEYDMLIQRAERTSVPMPEVRPEPTRATSMPFNDPMLSYQWHYYNDGWLGAPEAIAGADINLFNAWKYTAGDNRIIVAVVDGGIMADHRDLADNMWVNEAEKNGISGVDDDGNGYVDDIHGYNFVRDNGNITADAHGTHVAGTISAVNNNSFATCGIAGGTGNGDGVRLMSIQIFDNGDGCYSHQIAKGFKYAADNGAIIINNSWGFKPDGWSTDKQFENEGGILKQAIDYFEATARLEGVIEGGVAIFAAGNEALPKANYPGAYHSHIAVSAMASNFTAAHYSNYDLGCTLTAPGGDSSYGTVYCISSTSTTGEDGYEYMQGTFMATPHVSGCAALAVAHAMNSGIQLTSSELKKMIVTSVNDINPYQTGTKSIFDFATGNYNEIDLSKYAYKLGAGYIDAHLLLMQVEGTPCLYFPIGQTARLSLDEYFGGGSSTLVYDGCEMSQEACTTLGVTTAPTIEDGKLKIKCTKPGTARITVRAIIGADYVGGGDNIGGMLLEREFEIVVRSAVAANGGWL